MNALTITFFICLAAVTAHSRTQNDATEPNTEFAFTIKREHFQQLIQSHYLNSKQVNPLLAINEAGFPVRIVARSSNRFPGKFEVVILIGETHVLPCDLAQLFGKPLTDQFENFGVENPGAAEYNEIINFYNNNFHGHAGSYKANDPSKAEQATQDCHGPTYTLPNLTKGSVYNIESNGKMNPIQSAAFITELYRMDNNMPQVGDPNCKITSYQDLEPCTQARERRMLAEINQNKKIVPHNAVQDVRNKIMAQNIGKIFAGSPKPEPPLIVSVGAFHVPGIKYQLMLYQGYREIPLSWLKK